MQTVIGVFDDRAAAQRAVDRLVESGIGRDDVHVEQQDAGSTGAASTMSDDGGTASEHHHGIGHFFAHLFGMDDEENTRYAGRYSEAVRRGNCVVVVDATTGEQADKASALLHELGAVNVDERAEQWRAEGWKEPEYGTQQRMAGDRMTGERMAGEEALKDGKNGVLDVVQEELQVGKRAVDRGGVRVVQRVSEKPVRELVRLREERAVVERRPVDREASAEDLANFREGTMEVRETAEEAVVGKRARVVEEVRVGKEVNEREQQVEDTVRRKDVDVERIEGQGRVADRERAVARDDVDTPPTKPRKNR